MRIRERFLLLTLVWLGADAVPAQAAWNNVFQTCCHSCRSPASSSFFVPAPTSCPTVTYQQRCFYSPVTTYKMQTSYSPVTTYRTSYYWQPVTSYRYTSYYDPCTGCSQRVPEQTTSYQLRSQCNPVQSWVQRSQLVPVTEQRRSCYMEPVVSYAAPAPAPCQTCQPPSGGAITETPGAAPRPNGGVTESAEPPQRLGPTDVGPGTGNTNLRRTPAPAKPRLDRTASMPISSGAVSGRLVADDRITPMDRATVTFVSLIDGRTRETARTDSLGQFAVDLPKGEWAIYVPDRSGRADYHSRLKVESGDQRSVLVVTR